INVCMCDHDLFDGKLVLVERRGDSLDVVSRVDHDGFVSGRVADHRAVALQGTNREDLMDHVWIVSVANKKASMAKAFQSLQKIISWLAPVREREPAVTSRISVLTAP